jgi:antitoxin VapB
MTTAASSRSARKPEVDSKLKRLRERMAARQVDALLLNTIPNTAWITAGGALYVSEGTDGAASSILVTPDKAYVLTDGIEGPRLQKEEALDSLGFEIVAEPWHSKGKLSKPLMDGKRLGQDGLGAGVDMGSELRDLRSVLQDEEVARFRRVSALAGEAMDDAIRAVRPGDSEYELASRLSAGSRLRGGTAVVNLIASDERISQFRHPLPTAKTVERYAMLVLCLRIEGLIASVTRLVHFGPMPDELRKKAMAVARVDAKVILGTQAGRTMGDMFNLVKEAYKEEGYTDAIDQHHQGGSAAYSPREVIATPGDKTPIQLNQAFAWNPSVTGAKSEDTIILTAKGQDVMTVIDGWPTWEITVDGKKIARPAILEA